MAVALAPADPLIGLVVDGRYRIVDLIGRGGMGAVYRVEHVKMGKIMAMKLLHGELSHDLDVIKRFEREALAVSKLSHVNNVSVFDFGSHQGMMYLVMEYIDGMDLSEFLRVEGAMAPIRVLEILVQVCSGLIDAHSKGIVHRDLKPENIIIFQTQDQKDFVKVVDFGLAQLRDGPGKTKITQQGSLVGTPYYMAPEHIRGEKVDARTDIYALGAVMYKLVTSETPFSGPTPMGIITKHLTEEVEPPSVRFEGLAIPTDIDDIVLKAMSKNPEDRYQSVDELRTVLADVVVKMDPGSGVERFTSARSGSNWQLGETGAGADKSAWTMGGEANETPVVTHFPQAGSQLNEAAGRAREARPSTITIGARELSIGTKSDVIKFEKKIRTKRVVTTLALVLAVLCLLAGGAYFVLLHGKDDSLPTAETEPNNSPTEADTLTPSVQLAGFISSTTGDGDIDWFKLSGPPRGEWAVEAHVTGVPAADIALQLVLPGGNEALASVNRNGPDLGESVFPIVVGEPNVFLMIQEVRRAGVPAGNFPQRPYGLTYKMFDPATVEREPNNSSGLATAASVGTPIQGRFDKDGDVDWYCLPAGQPASVVQVSGVLDVDIVLGLVMGQGGNQVTINNGLAGVGEGVSLEGAAGPVCVSVSSLGPAPIERPYQITYQ